MPKITLSVIKADVGGFVGHSDVHPDLLSAANEYLADKGKGLLTDYHVTRVGDDMQLIMTHDRGTDNEDIHQLAWDVFLKATEVARQFKTYGAGRTCSPIHFPET